MQDSFVDAYTNLSKFENRSSFKTWIIRIMLSNCFRKQQKSSYKNEVRNEISEGAVPIFSTRQDNDTINSVMNNEQRHVIENALAKVPEDYRIVFSLREMNGLNVLETAEALSISESNVKVRLNRAKAMLRKEIEKTYTSEDIYEFNLVYCDSMVERVMKIINIRNLDYNRTHLRRLNTSLPCFLQTVRTYGAEYNIANFL